MVYHKVIKKTSTLSPDSKPLGVSAVWLLVVWILGCSLAYYAVFLARVPAVQRLLHMI